MRELLTGVFEATSRASRIQVVHPEPLSGPEAGLPPQATSPPPTKAGQLPPFKGKNLCSSSGRRVFSVSARVGSRSSPPGHPPVKARQNPTFKGELMFSLRGEGDSYARGGLR